MRDWLDAGYVMLVEDADGTARRLLDALFDAETEDAMRQAFADLRAEVDYRAEQARKAEAEHRKATGGPSHHQRVAPGALEAVADEWRQITGKGADPPGEDEPAV